MMTTAIGRGNSEVGEQLKRTGLAALLAVLGLAGNALALPVSFGVSFIFGSIFSILAAARLGVWHGASVALVASLYTYFPWNHPYAIFIFTLETLWIGLAFKQGRSNILLIDALYWLFLGSPLIALFYGAVMDLGAQHTTTIILKQTLNGLFNALIAWLLLSFLPIVPRLGGPVLQGRIPFQQLIFQMAAIFLMVPSLGMFLFQAHREVSASQQRIARDILAESQLTANSVAHWVAVHVNAARVIGELGSSHPLTPSEKLQEEVARIHALFPDFHNVFLGDATATTVAFHPPVNEKGQPTIGINFADRAWFKELSSTLRPTISDVFLGRGGIFAPTFSISVPILRDGKLSHFGLGAINLRHMRKLLDLAREGKEFIYTVVDRNGNVVISTDETRRSLAPLVKTRGGTTSAIAPGVTLTVPGARKHISVMEAWEGAYYATTLPVSGTPWTLQTEYPIAPVQHYFYKSTILGFSIVAGFAAIMIAFAAIISRMLTAQILYLARVSKNLPARIEKREPISWPQSKIMELAELIENFQQASTSIDKNFSKINEYSLNLEETVQKRTAELVRERQRLDHIIEGTNVGTWEWNVQTGEVTFNERWAGIIGYRLAELAPLSIQTWLTHTHPDDLKVSEALLERHFSGATDYYECECRMRHRAGHWIWVLDRGKLASRTEDGKPLIMSGTHADITRRKNTELELREKTSQLQALTNELEQRVEKELALRRKGEQLLFQQSKLAAMGEMLGAISHQWRQPLNALALIIQNIRDAYSFGEMAPERLEHSAQKAMAQIQHMSGTIDDFRNFFRPDKEKAEFDPMRAVGDVLGLMSAQLAANGITFRLACTTHGRVYENETEFIACESMTVTGHRNEFQHVILNLLNNARDAIIEHGKAVSGATRPPGRIDLEFQHTGAAVIIAVKDNGGGISPEIVDRIFEPYFTTKAPDKGTGLGLYMSKVIMEHMGGTLTAGNSGQGAVFVIELPFAESSHGTPTRNES
ncbi:sensor histidine kinase [Thiovibrio sp. JS02]